MGAKAFATSDFSLAITLASLGVPLVNHKGQPAKAGECPEWREIRAEELEARGWTFEDAIEHGYVGEVSYGFGQHPERKKIIDAFRKTQKQPDASREMPDTLVVKDASGKKVEISVNVLMATFAAVLFKNRKRFAERQKRVSAKLRITTDTGHIIIDPRATDEVRQHFGVE